MEGDAAKAFAHYEAAAKDGEKFAALPLALMYYDGRGAPRDMQKARHWFKAAALSLVTASKRRDGRMK